METIVPDCLVLKIEEYDSETCELDTSIFVLYDKKEHQYVLRGRRKITEKYDARTYSFVCDSATDLANFISYVICQENLWTYVLYNYDNLPTSSDNITHEFLVKNESPEYEITAYDKITYNKYRLLQNLQMLRNVFNYYN
jgi:hypothetical protein